MKSEHERQPQTTPVFLKKISPEDTDGLRDPHAQAYDHAPVGYCILNEKGMFLEINLAGLTMLQATRNQLHKISISRYIFPDDHDIYYHYRKRLLETSKPQTFELRMVRTDNTVFFGLLAASLVLEEDSALRYHIVITDISEHKKEQQKNDQGVLDRRLKKTDRAPSVDRLAGGVAHSFNNMLGVISGYTEMALQQIQEDHPLYSDLLSIKFAADRCAELTHQLLAFSGRRNAAPQIVEVNRILDKNVTLLQYALPPGVQLSWRPGQDIWQVRIDPAQLEQIFNHLCENGVEAITESGTVTIKTENHIVDNPVPCGHYRLGCGDYVLITVSDDGCGIDPQTLDHVFEPFFTTKTNGSGLGLGLATVHEAIKQIGGHIDINSSSGEGTVVRVYLPRYRAENEPDTPYPEQGPMNAPLQNSMETILLVDDEPIILQMVARLLEHRGYVVLQANNAEEALRITDEFGGNIDLLLTDVVMPGMNGDDLAQQLLLRYPALKCLFMSGYGIDVVTGRGLFQEDIHFIQKPFGIKDVIDSIQKVLTGQ